MKLSIVALLLTTVVGPTSAFAPIARHDGNISPSSSSSALLRMANHLEIRTGRSQLDTDVVSRFDALPYPSDKILAEYVWVDSKGECRSKTRTLPASRVGGTSGVDALPKWNFDGSSTGQAPGDDSEVILRPRRIFRDPFRPRADGPHNILVMCDCYTPSGTAIPSNTRAIGEQNYDDYDDDDDDDEKVCILYLFTPLRLFNI